MRLKIMGKLINDFLKALFYICDFIRGERARKWVDEKFFLNFFRIFGIVGFLELSDFWLVILMLIK